MSETEDQEIGFKKPPKATRWKPGQSGNLKGRPKKTKDFERLLDRELSLSVRITDGGQILTMTKREILIKKLVNEALKGDRAAAILLGQQGQLHAGRQLQTLHAFFDVVGGRLEGFAVLLGFVAFEVLENFDEIWRLRAAPALDKIIA